MMQVTPDVDVDEFLGKVNSLKSQGVPEEDISKLVGMPKKSFKNFYNLCVELKNNIKR